MREWPNVHQRFIQESGEKVHRYTYLCIIKKIKVSYLEKKLNEVNEIFNKQADYSEGVSVNCS